MQWPWVSRNAAIFVLAARDREIALLNRELQFYRDKFEGEKERADRAVDSALEAVGREPISEPVRKEYTKLSEAALAMQDQMSEVFSDTAKSLLEDPSSDPVPEPEPSKETFEENRERRLNVLRAIQRATVEDNLTGVAASDEQTSAAATSGA